MQTTVQPDVLYQRSREALLSYEDARFNTLAADIPNCYTQISDSTLWGCFVRALAQEMARIEYMLSYDLVALDPQYLTPPDIKRRWAGPLFINKSYPDITTYDINYKAMLVGLLHAYPEGATVQAISDVVLAYTGQTVVIEELYKEIGNGVYDDTYRNTIKLSLNAVGPDPLTETVSASRLIILAQNLYAGIDLAKPAHIGLDYSILFGNGEDLSSNIAAITDVLSLVFDGVEPSSLPLVFTDAPFFDPASPDTRLTAYGKRVGTFMSASLTGAEFAALASAAMQAEYLANGDGTYTLNPACYNDILLVDGNDVPTGVVSKAVGVLAPELYTGWEIKSDELRIYRLD